MTHPGTPVLLQGGWRVQAFLIAEGQKYRLPCGCFVTLSRAALQTRAPGVCIWHLLILHVALLKPLAAKAKELLQITVSGKPDQYGSETFVQMHLRFEEFSCKNRFYGSMYVRIYCTSNCINKCLYVVFFSVIGEPVSINWFSPQGERIISNQRVIVHTEGVRSRLTIYNAIIEDAGIYRCQAVDTKGQSQEATVVLEIYRELPQ